MPKYCMSHNNILKLEHLHCMFLFQVDLEGLRTVSSDRGRAMAAELGLPYFETSAATGQGDLLQISYPHSVLVLVWNMFENNPFVQVLKTLWKHCWTLSWQESRGVLPISGFDKSNYKTKSLLENWEECQTYFQAKGQFKMWITHKQNFREEQTSSTSPPAQAWPRPFRFPSSR